MFFEGSTSEDVYTGPLSVHSQKLSPVLSSIGPLQRINVELAHLLCSDRSLHFSKVMIFSYDQWFLLYED